MQIELGGLIAGVIATLGAFATAILYAASAKSEASRANERIDEINTQLAELRGKHDALDNKIVDRLSAIEKALARIQGRLDLKVDSFES